MPGTSLGHFKQPSRYNATKGGYQANDKGKNTKEAEMYLSLLCIGEVGRLV